MRLSLPTILLCAMMLSLAAGARADDYPPLKHGVSLSSWFAGAPRQPLLERDFIQIQQAGFDHVRLSVDPMQIGFMLNPYQHGLATTDFTRMDKAIHLATDRGLAVVLDIHPNPRFMKALEEWEWTENEFATFPAAIAKRYKDIPPSLLAFELLNEPQYYGQEAQYDRFMRKLVAAVRKVDAKRLLIVDGPHGSSLDGLELIQPIDDAAILYGFHFFEPDIITHQGTSSGFENTAIPYLSMVPYPSSQVVFDARTYAKYYLKKIEAQRELDDYVLQGWNDKHIAARIARARAWADKHHVRVVCGAFGVLRTHISPESRYRWIEDTRKALEASGIGWEIWDYSDLFGITSLIGKLSPPDPIDGSVWLMDVAHGFRALEPEALSALGLQ